MSDSVLDKRVQASVPSELKDHIREMVENELYESEAEIIRVALRQFIEGDLPVETPVETPANRYSHVETLNTDLHRDLKERMDLLAWLMTVGLLLMATIASRILQALTHETVQPMSLLDQALSSSVHERDQARRRLAAGWRAFKQVGQEAHNGKSSRA
ncbi:MAG: hypothetical protein HXY41_01425 [Chloroflexi bacterium]|nr:hypothetical protein [Chloroflexota bacterium]